MGLQTAMRGDRLQITLLGRINAGKSSLINALTGQQAAIVSEVKGTTTDPVSKAMEILPLGACMITDTPGLDDEGELGRQRISKTEEIIRRTDIALLVLDVSSLCQTAHSGKGLPDIERTLLETLRSHDVKVMIALNQADKISEEKTDSLLRSIQEEYPGIPVVVTSATEGSGIEALRDALASLAPEKDAALHIVGDLIQTGDTIVLVVPVDSAAPKGRLIMPQQQTIRDILDNQAVAVVTQVPQLSSVLQNLQGKVRMVITDSQAFKEVDARVPSDIPLTSFSILFARHKGSLQKLVSGVAAVDRLRDGDKVLIAEGCTHRRQCEDIGTVKIPRWLKEHSGKKIEIVTCSGTEFPDDLSDYALVIHCGGCTLHEKEMKHRMESAGRQGVPIVNYGIFIAYVNGILRRSLELFPSVYDAIS